MEAGAADSSVGGAGLFCGAETEPFLDFEVEEDAAFPLPDFAWSETEALVALAGAGPLADVAVLLDDLAGM